MRLFILQRWFCWGLWAPLFFSFLLGESLQAASSSKVSIVPKWDYFERSFKSTVHYANSCQEAKLTVVFASPSGATNRIEGYWDGGKTWRVRFCPDEAGRWSYRTVCTDTANGGLNNQAGEFLCSTAFELGPFSKHGPVRISRDGRHFEHKDGTPFFWFADTAGMKGLEGSLKAWQTYAIIRAAQNFTVSKWSPLSGEEREREAAFSGLDRISIQPAYFKKLDERISMLRRCGLLSAINPLSILQSPMGSTGRLPEDQIVLLARYMIDRWGAEPVAWVLELNENSSRSEILRWLRIARAIFADSGQSVVAVRVGRSPDLFQPLTNESWLGAFSFLNGRPLLTNGMDSGIANLAIPQWATEPARPVIELVPCDFARKSDARSDDGLMLRRLLYESFIDESLAGIDCYGEPPVEFKATQDATAWESALQFGAEGSTAHFSEFVNGLDFWKLRPRMEMAPVFDSKDLPRRLSVAAASSDAKDLAIIYAPEGLILEVLREALPRSPVMTWYDPRTGRKTAASPVVRDRFYQITKPDPRDWVLVVQSASAHSAWLR